MIQEDKTPSVPEPSTVVAPPRRASGAAALIIVALVSAALASGATMVLCDPSATPG